MKGKVFVGLVISAIFIYLAFREVELEEVWVGLKGANYIWLFPALSFMLFSHWLRALRWRYILEPIKKAKVHPLFSALMIGYAANNIFPLRLGEFLRAFAVGKSQRISKTSAFATVLVERLIDILSLLVLLAITFVFFPLPDLIKKSGYIIFLGAVATTGVVILLVRRTESTILIFKKILPAKIFELVQHVIRSFLDGFIVFKKTEHYLSIIVLSILVWVFYVAVVYVSFYAFAFPANYDINLFSSLVVLVIVSIGIMIPSSPGFVGTYHWFCMKSLALFGIPESEALGFAVISHAVNTIPFTIIGLFYFWRENLHFSDAVAEKELVTHEVEEETFSSKPG